ncbi:MAG: hypothetical protein L0Z62_43650 [Gemmataceae bacterium]|nr:hypothetical protein [Gemmataceae bacterium]
MERIRLVVCWNCSTSQPATDFATGRCPLCGARCYPNPVVLALGLTFSGLLVGWVGGLCFGVASRLLGWKDDVLTTASSGCLLGALVFGWLGLCLAVLFGVARVAERHDEDLRRRGAEIRKARTDRGKSVTNPKLEIQNEE